MIQIAQQKTAAQAARLFAVIAAIAVLAFALTACAGGGEKTETTFTKSENGVEMSMTYYATGDIVTKQTTENVITYETLGVEDKAAAQEMLDPMTEEFKGIEGLEHNVEYGDTAATETITVDYEKADLSKVAELTGSSFTGNTDGDAKVSLKQSREVLEQNGFTEVK